MTCKPCGGRISAGPRPYYQEVEGNVLENHETVIYQREAPAGVLSCDSWNVPALNKDITIKLQSVTIIPVGAYLFSPYYGYFLISQWNPETSQIGVVNDGTLDTADAGTFVPAFTPFLITPKPCCENDTSSFFPFLAEDFIAPAGSQSETISVTNTFGLTIGNLIRIGSAVYRLNGINSTREIIIFNLGAGFPTGDLVLAKDVNDEYQYLITPEAAYVCTVDVETTTGRLIVCEGGDQKIITGGAVGQVPHLQDPITGVVEFEHIGTISIADRSITREKIALGAVGTGELDTGAVVTANIGANQVVASHILDGAVLTSKIADLGVTTGKIANTAITTPKIADGAVTTVKIGHQAVTAFSLADGGVETLALADDSVTAAKLADGAVTTDKIGNLEVTNNKIAVSAVTVSKLGDLAVTTAKIDNTAVTSAKLALNAVLSTHIASVAAVAGVYTPIMAMEVAVAGLTATGYYYVVGSIIIAHMQFSGTPDAAFSTLSVTLPTATADDGSPGTSIWPAIVTQVPLDAADTSIVSQMRKAHTEWSVGSSTNGAMIFWFSPSIPLGAYVSFEAWGIYPYK